MNLLKKLGLKKAAEQGGADLVPFHRQPLVETRPQPVVIPLYDEYECYPTVFD